MSSKKTRAKKTAKAPAPKTPRATKKDGPVAQARPIMEAAKDWTEYRTECAAAGIDKFTARYAWMKAHGS